MSTEQQQDAKIGRNEIHQENIHLTNLQQQFPQSSQIDGSSTQFTQLCQASGTVESYQISQITNSIGNYVNLNNTHQASLLNSDISVFTLSVDEYQNELKSQINQVEIINEEEQNNSSAEEQDLLLIPSSFQSLKKSLTYDELSRKCQNLEDEGQLIKQKYEKIMKLNVNFQDKISNLEEQEKNLIQALDEKISQIQELEDKYQKQVLENKQLIQKNSDQEICIQKQLERINQISIQVNQYIQQNDSLKLQIKEKETFYQKSLKITKDQYEKNLQLKMTQMEQKTDLKLNEKLKIKEQIINYLENELADSKLSNSRPKQEIKLQINKNGQKIANNNVINSIFQSQKIHQNNDKQLLKSQGHNQSFSNLNCSITESLNQNFLANSHRNLID